MAAPCRQLLHCLGLGRGSHLPSLLLQVDLRRGAQAGERCAPRAPIPACLAGSEAYALSRLGHGRAVPPRWNCAVLKYPRFHPAAGASGILPPDNAATAEGLGIRWTLGSWRCNL